MRDLEHPKYFYHPPSDEDIETSGPIFAREKAIARAHRLSSRVFSASMAVVTGSVITTVEYIATGAIDYRTALSTFLTPALVNAISQIRAEREQRHSLARIGRIAMEAREGFDELAAENIRLQARNSVLEAAVRQAGGLSDLGEDP